MGGPDEEVMMEVEPVEDALMEVGLTGDVLIGLAAADGPEEVEIAAADGPREGVMMGGGPPPWAMGGGPPMMRQRMMRFRGGPMGRMRGRPMMGMMGGPMMLARVRMALGLTDEQVNKMHGLRMAHQKDMIRLGSDARIARMELAETLRQPTPKPEDVKAKVAAVNAARGQMLEKRVNFRLEMKKVLTPEQQGKIREMMMGRMMRRGQGGWGGGWGWGGEKKAEPKEQPKGEPKK